MRHWLHVPGEFFVSADGSWAADPEFVVDLRQKIRQVRPVTPLWHGGESRRTSVPQALASDTHVFVRVDAHRRPPQSPYQGPFDVVERRDKFFKLDIARIPFHTTD